MAEAQTTAAGSPTVGGYEKKKAKPTPTQPAGSTPGSASGGWEEAKKVNPLMTGAKKVARKIKDKVIPPTEAERALRKCKPRTFVVSLGTTDSAAAHGQRTVTVATKMHKIEARSESEALGSVIKAVMKHSRAIVTFNVSSVVEMDEIDVLGGLVR